MSRGPPRDQRPGVALVERQAEIDQDRTSIVGEDDIGRLDVTVHHSLRVRVREGVGNGRDGARRFLEIGPALLQVRKQAGPGKQRRDDVAMLAFDPRIEHGDDARMLQPGELAGFLDERRAAFRGVRPSDVSDLDRDRPIQLAIETFVHGGEPSASDGATNDVAPEPARSRARR